MDSSSVVGGVGSVIGAVGGVVLKESTHGVVHQWRVNSLGAVDDDVEISKRTRESSAIGVSLARRDVRLEVDVWKEFFVDLLGDEIVFQKEVRGADDFSAEWGGW